MEDPAEMDRFLTPAIEARAAAIPGEEVRLLEDLRAGDEQAFLTLVERYQGSMLRIAMLYVASREAAEECVQETWLAVFQGVTRFEGRSALKTWLFSILANRAKTRGARERKTVPLSALGAEADPGDGPTVEEGRFGDAGSRWPGHWRSAPRSWGERPDQLALSKEVRARIDAAIRTLPEVQRLVITLRDVEGMSSEEVCNVLELTETNQRVILHRARGKVRRALEAYFEGDRHA